METVVKEKLLRHKNTNSRVAEEESTQNTSKSARDQFNRSCSASDASDAETKGAEASCVVDADVVAVVAVAVVVGLLAFRVLLVVWVFLVVLVLRQGKNSSGTTLAMLHTAINSQSCDQLLDDTPTCTIK